MIDQYSNKFTSQRISRIIQEIEMLYTERKNEFFFEQFDITITGVNSY
jgi:hypothetical protein